MICCPSILRCSVDVSVFAGCGWAEEVWFRNELLFPELRPVESVQELAGQLRELRCRGTHRSLRSTFAGATATPPPCPYLSIAITWPRHPSSPPHLPQVTPTICRKDLDTRSQYSLLSLSLLQLSSAFSLPSSQFEVCLRAFGWNILLEVQFYRSKSLEEIGRVQIISAWSKHRQGEFLLGFFARTAVLLVPFCFPDKRIEL